MFQSLCIVKSKLYLSRADLPTLISFLTKTYTEEELSRSDQAKLIFLGEIKEESYFGTLSVTGNKGCEVALGHLEKLIPSTARIDFAVTSNNVFNERIDDISFPLISEPYYEGLPFKVKEIK